MNVAGPSGLWGSRRRIALVVLLLLLLGMGGAAFIIRATNSDPLTATIASPVTTALSAPRAFRLDDAPRGSKSLLFAFEIVNRGTASVEIVRIATTCGCTSAAPQTAIIAPGGATLLEGAVVANKTAGDFLVRVYAHDSSGGMTSTNVSVLLVDPLPTTFSPPAGADALTLPIHPAYAATEYDWRAYALPDDRALDVAIRNNGDGDQLEISGLDGATEVVIVFVELTEERTRMSQRLTAESPSMAAGAWIPAVSTGGQ